MTTMHRKLLRDLARLRGPALSLGLLVAVGVAVFEAMTGAWLALRDARDGWYASARFPDILASVPETPVRIARAIEALPGVADVEVRLAAEVRVEATADQPQAAVHLVSVPQTLGKLHLRSGLLPGPETPGIQGVPSGGHLFVLRDAALRPLILPADGIVLSARIAQRLGLRAGDLVDLERLEGRPEHRLVRISGVVSDHLGPGAYADLDALLRLLGVPAAYTGARLQVDPAHRDELLAALRRRPYVASVASQADAVATFQTTFADMMRMFSTIIVLFALVLVAGVAYNGARVALAERARDLTTLRILGMRQGEVMSLLVGETMVQVLAGLPLGLLVGWGLAHGLAGMVDPEMMEIPVHIGPNVWLLATVVTLTSAIASALLVARQLGRLDLRTAMQTRE